MVDQRFFANHGPLRLQEIVDLTGATAKGDAALSLVDVAPLDRATASDISFFDNPKYIEQYINSAAGACFVKDKFAAQAPAGMALLICDDPYRAYALVAQRLYPFVPPTDGISPKAEIHSTASIGTDVTIDSGVVIGRNVSIGDGCIISANAVIGDGVSVGRQTRIGACSTISHALIGESCIIHRGVHIGQDGFGFALGRDGHVKVPQLGRVVIDNDVEIGAGTCIDRGTGPDTMIGEGTKIDNLVQIGHNVQIGKRVIIVSQVGISGSTRIGDGVVIGGQAGIAGHLKIGPGARLAARSGVAADIPAGKVYGGTPAVPIKDWHRQVIALNRIIKKDVRGSNDD